jgi:hypothetical protein
LQGTDEQRFQGIGLDIKADSRVFLRGFLSELVNPGAVFHDVKIVAGGVSRRRNTQGGRDTSETWNPHVDMLRPLNSNNIFKCKTSNININSRQIEGKDKANRAANRDINTIIVTNNRHHKTTCL